ncbi:HK97-gp10 family putative phage morphogenesis protein [Clostridium sp. D33t1_170424_F3]|uniref:HK97-gp10 family putative phage morphogenesis protein n=1 Tax=Clostridium sp. D33t1_170424_F3 TaxID=2787099 RepID=UPI0018A8E3A7|nr:HK97-gp10 family putative phage morphogenesis protein [Clostridium sp. D33t1_170424_F3]
MNDLDNLIAQLKNSKLQVDIAVERGVRKAGLHVEGDAKRLCPVDTGRLRSSIATHGEYEGSNFVAEVGTTVGYAPFVEFGTGQRGDPEVPHRQDWMGQPPHPYLRPALQENTENGNIDKIVTSELKKVLK